MKILIYKNYEKLQNVKTFTKKALIDSKSHVTIIQQLFIGLIHIVCKRVHKVAKRECWKNKDQWKCLKKNKNESWATPLILNDYDKTALEKIFFETSVIFFK